MVQKNLEKQIRKVCEYLEFYDNNGFFPFKKVRVDITLSQEALVKIEGMNRSKVINNLILAS